METVRNIFQIGSTHQYRMHCQILYEEKKEELGEYRRHRTVLLFFIPFFPLPFKNKTFEIEARSGHIYYDSQTLRMNQNST